MGKHGKKGSPKKQQAKKQQGAVKKAPRAPEAGDLKRARQRAPGAAPSNKVRGGGGGGSSVPALSMAELAASARARSAAFPGGGEAETVGTHDSRLDACTAAARTSKAYSRELAKVVEAADVILELLDARDPLGSRSERVEDLVERSGGSKRLVLVLNKIDLVPREVAAKWLDRLRRTGLAVLAFKASTQKGGVAGVAQGLDSVKDAAVAVDDGGASARSTAVGVDALLQLLKNYARDGSGPNSSSARALTVGVVGFPNAGKSSLIRSLVGARSNKTTAGAVSATAGSTTALREVRLDKHLVLIDSPGVVAVNHQENESPTNNAATAPSTTTTTTASSNTNKSSLASLLVRGCVEAADLRDAPEAVQGLLDLADPQALTKKYGGLVFEGTRTATGGPVDARRFLANVARHRGKLKRGGIPDIEAAARDVILDFKRGAMPFYTEPPPDDDAVAGENAATTIVPAIAANFNPLNAVLAVHNRPKNNNSGAKRRHGLPTRDVDDDQMDDD